MKRQNHRHTRKRASRPSAFKRQMQRKEAQKSAKYPLRITYVQPKRQRQVQKRGA